MRLLLLLLVPGVAFADPPEFKPYRDPRRGDTTAADAEQGAAKLTAAIRARDARGIQRLLAKTVHFDGAWFADTACRKRFGRREVLKTTGAHAALAKCLAGVKLQASTRKSASDDGAVLTMDPGIEIELAFEGTRVRWLAFVGQQQADKLVPTLTAQAFEALRTAGSTTNLDTKLKKLDPTVARFESATAWLRVCLDETGAITSKQVIESNPAMVDEVPVSFTAAIVDWKFKPFSPGGIATPACSLSLLTYPAAKAPDVETLPNPASPARVIVHKVDDDDLDGVEGGEEGGVVGGTIGAPPPPPPPPPPVNVPPTLLEGQRTAGNKVILPDEATKRAIKQSGKDKVVGVWKLCIDTNGSVLSITMLKSTGFAGYDKTITSEMRTWKYRPYLVNRKAQPVCTAATFIYSK
jgi:hypothetical protein